MPEPYDPIANRKDPFEHKTGDTCSRSDAKLTTGIRHYLPVVIHELAANLQMYWYSTSMVTRGRLSSKKDPAVLVFRIASASCWSYDLATGVRSTAVPVAGAPAPENLIHVRAVCVTGSCLVCSTTL